MRLSAVRLRRLARGRRALGAEPVQLVDVRNPGEQADGVIPGAVCIPLAALLGRIDELDPAATTVVYCAGGYRSSIAASALAARGFAKVADILGGYDAWKAAGFPTGNARSPAFLRNVRRRHPPFGTRVLQWLAMQRSTSVRALKGLVGGIATVSRLTGRGERRGHRRTGRARPRQGRRSPS